MKSTAIPGAVHGMELSKYENRILRHQCKTSPFWTPNIPLSVELKGAVHSYPTAPTSSCLVPSLESEFTLSYSCMMDVEVALVLKLQTKDSVADQSFMSEIGTVGKLSRWTLF